MPIHLPGISRRAFLAGSLAAGSGLLLPARSFARPACFDPNRFALLADTHVWETRDQATNGVKPADNLNQALRAILAMDPRPAGLLMAGDTVRLEGHAADYAVLADVLRPVRGAGLPLDIALGNHDNRENFWQAFPEARCPGRLTAYGKHVSVVHAPCANWFLLDSLDKTNVTPGRLGQPQLDWLAWALDCHADKPALVLAHHNPEQASKISGLTDTKALFDVLRPRSHVKAYVFGHTHAWRLMEQDGIHLVNLPTTAWPFDKDAPRGWVEAQLSSGGVRLVLHALDPKHKLDGQTADLRWRLSEPAPCRPRPRRRLRRVLQSRL